MSSLCQEVQQKLETVESTANLAPASEPSSLFRTPHTCPRALDPLNLLTNLDISVKPHLQSSVCICIVPNPLSPTNTNMAILLRLAIYAYA